MRVYHESLFKATAEVPPGGACYCCVIPQRCLLLLRCALRFLQLLKVHAGTAAFSGYWLL